MRTSWLAPYLSRDPAVAAAERRVAALGDAAHADVASALGALAEGSPLLALRAHAHAAAAWTRFGRDGFHRWIAIGREFADGGGREGALAFFGTSPAALGRLDVAERWCALGLEVGRTSRRLAGTFLERTAPVLRLADGIVRLAAWVEAGLALHRGFGWRGAFLAQAYFDAAPRAPVALGPSDYRPWAELGALLSSAPEEREFFATLPAGIERWGSEERTRFFEATRRLAAGAARHARIVYRELPPALAGVDPAVRATLLGTIARLDGHAGAALAGFVPVAGAVLSAVPADERVGVLGLVEALAGRDGEAAVAALRMLARLFEEADAASVRRWFATGMDVAADNVLAGRAYFALESRTSRKVLAAGSTAASLEETEGVWRKLVQMLSGEAASIRGVDAVSLRPPLEDFPAEGEVALPSRIDALPTHEENCRLYRFLACQLAGRREFGTYAHPDLRGVFTAEGASPLLEDLFLLAEGVRVDARLTAAYPGLAGEAAWIGRRLVGVWRDDPAPSRAMVLDTLLLLALGAAERPPWLAADLVTMVTTLLAPLAAPGATVEDSLAVARALAGAFTARVVRLPEAELDPRLVFDLTGGDPLDVWSSDDDAAAGGASDAARVPMPDPPSLELAPPGDDAALGGQPLTPEELLRLLEAGAKIQQATGIAAGGSGLPITALLGKLPAAQLEALRKLLAEGDGGGLRAAAVPGQAIDEHAFFYDEWDHAIGDYRSRWCRLLEVSPAGDSGEFFTRTLADYAKLLPEIRRQFQRIRPEMYRTIRGLEDGEDFDLNSAIDARVDLRARRSPSTRLYVSRVREARDVATLFLLDMSASTDEPLAESAGRRGRRIIDALKEALVIMTEALDELGDAYAIYGFSGQGRANVEFYLVKAFGESLGPSVKARIGGIAPKRSTRMGAALRHATWKMAAVAARVKHLMLLSDGFPQDDDYGDDRRSHTYGIRDTAAALREADAAGITPFCITVDRAGHDYLREMCDASRYMVLEDTAALPRELPKIYRRVVRA